MSTVSSHSLRKSLTFGRDYSFISMSFSNNLFCAPSLLQVSLSCLRLSVLLVLTLIRVFFMLYLVWHESLSISFAFCKFRLHFPIIVASASFGHGKRRISHKCSFGFFQVVILVLMIYNYHEDMCYSHSQSFKLCHTSVVIVVAKCTFSVALGESCHIVITLGGLCCLYVHSD